MSTDKIQNNFSLSYFNLMTSLLAVLNSNEDDDTNLVLARYLLEHFHERRDLPRTLLNAFISYPDGLEEGLRSRSPIHRIDAMKRIPYFIVAGGADDQVSKANHADPLVKLMREKNFDITYHEIPTMRHWHINDYDVWKSMMDFITER